jgi:hypothetical protein
MDAIFEGNEGDEKAIVQDHEQALIRVGSPVVTDRKN